MSLLDDRSREGFEKLTGEPASGLASVASGELAAVHRAILEEKSRRGGENLSIYEILILDRSLTDPTFTTDTTPSETA